MIALIIWMDATAVKAPALNATAVDATIMDYVAGDSTAGDSMMVWNTSRPFKFKYLR